MRTGMNDAMPLRHWHQNDPGSIPNVLNNGSGSPSGVEVYEGDLLPAKLYGGIVHCEPGHNVVRVYLPQTQGAGYTAETIELIDGRSDPWFRPVDAASAPDGSLMIADWYDPGVGGHRQADIDHGRIYRIAPPGATYRCKEPDLQTAAAACAALCSANHSERYAAWTALESMSAAAESELGRLSLSEDSRSRARAYWLLTRLPDKSSVYLKRAAEDTDPRVRAAAASMTCEADDDALSVFSKLVGDPSPQVRRAATIALRRFDHEDYAPLWAQLAKQFDGQDRWYLEALGLAADRHWDQCLDAWLTQIGKDDWKTPAGRMLIWRSRGQQTFDMLMTLLADPTTPAEELPKLLRAIDFNASPNADTSLVTLAVRARHQPIERRVLIASEALMRVKSDSADDRLAQVLFQLLNDMPRNDNYSQLVKKFRRKDHYAGLLPLALGPQADTSEGVDSIKFLLGEDLLAPVKAKLGDRDSATASLVRMLGQTSERKTLGLLMPLLSDTQAEIALRREAVRAIAANKLGAERLIKLGEEGQLEPTLQSALWFSLRTSPWQHLRERAELAFPAMAQVAEENLLVVEWMKISGDARLGELLFAGKANCASCHKVGDQGKEVGPSLSEIGSKLSHTGLYEAILSPSLAISHNYESYLALTDTGTTIVGVLIGETDQTVTLKTDKAVIRELQREELEAFQKQDISLMPSGLHELITPQELADLVKYLQSLKKVPVE